MNYATIVWMGFSILPAALFAILRLRQIDRAFYPLVLCLFLAASNEIISVLFQEAGWHTSVNNNIYVLCEALLLVKLLYNFGAFRKHAVFVATMALLIAAWAIENLFSGELHIVHSEFRLLYSIVIVVLSTRVICRLVLTEKSSILKNSVFIIVAGFLVYFTYKILVEIFWLYGFNTSPDFLEHIYFIHAWINLICNLNYCLAVRWMPAKQPYSMPY